MLKKSGYNHIISLGEACFVANMLKETKERHFSSPFDWVMGANLRTRLEFILNDFEGFLNIENLIPYPPATPPEHFDAYINTKNGMIFNHDFRNELPFEEAFKEASEKYQRRIDRLINLFSSPCKIVLLYMDMLDKKDPNLTVDNLTEYMVRINTKFKESHIQLVYFQYTKDLKSGDIKNINKYLSIAEYKGILPEEIIESIKRENREQKFLKNN